MFSTASGWRALTRGKIDPANRIAASTFGGWIKFPANRIVLADGELPDVPAAGAGPPGGMTRTRADGRMRSNSRRSLSVRETMASNFARHSVSYRSHALRSRASTSRRQPRLNCHRSRAAAAPGSCSTRMVICPLAASAYCAMV